jgi:thioredoxin reductase
VEINDQGLKIVDKDGETRTLKADTIVPAFPLTPDMALYESLKGKIPELYAVGDCKDPLLIADAIGTASQTARNI